VKIILGTNYPFLLGEENANLDDRIVEKIKKGNLINIL
tara:strand:+ start:800 stop:913 length:114 start_codon:yes stop_codon:yes gene_type:complete